MIAIDTLFHYCGRFRVLANNMPKTQPPGPGRRAGLSAVAVAQPMVIAAERGDLALVPYYRVRDQWVTGEP